MGLPSPADLAYLMEQVVLVPQQSLTFYTYSCNPTDYASRWDPSVPDLFFDSFDAVRREVLRLRDELDDSWRAVSIEKIETLPLTTDTLLALLNDGVGGILTSYEIAAVIE